MKEIVQVSELLQRQIDLWNKVKKYNREQMELLRQQAGLIDEMPYFQEKEDCIQEILNEQESLDEVVAQWQAAGEKSKEELERIQDNLNALKHCQEEVMNQNMAITGELIAQRKKIQEMRKGVAERKNAIHSYSANTSPYEMFWLDEKN